MIAKTVKIYVVFLVVFQLSCADQKKTDDQEDLDVPSVEKIPEIKTIKPEPKSTAKNATNTSIATHHCQVPSSVDNAPKTIAALITYINALPKPTTASCFLQGLKRPLAINATTNQFSAQGAVNEKSPRIFIRFGSLILSLVGKGESGKAIEIAQEINATMSIKGDISLPILGSLSPTDPFKKLMDEDNFPSCANSCHADYLVVKTWESGVVEYASRIIFPRPTLRASLDDMKRLRAACVTWQDENELCEFYKAIFDYGEVTYFEYQEAGK